MAHALLYLPWLDGFYTLAASSGKCMRILDRKPHAKEHQRKKIDNAINTRDAPGNMTTLAKMESFSKFKSSFWWQASYSVISGLIGMLLVVFFLTGVMSVGTTVKHLPWILGFNASVAGYTLLDRAGEKLRHKKSAGVGVGLLVAVLACILLELLTLKMTGMGLLDWPEMLAFIFIAAACGGFGAWLRLKYLSIKGN